MRIVLLCLAALPLIAAVPSSLVSNDLPLNLKMLPDEVKNGAVCLDGTPYGFYFAPATSQDHANDWQIFFQGGGWCYNELDCYYRSQTTLGSSNAWGKTINLGGISSSDCNVNPDFCQFNRVMLTYCDGNSFSGTRQDPLVVEGHNVYFRGKNNLDAALRTLMTMGLDKAENVMLTGCSAGGLSTYLHADYVGKYLSQIQTLKKYKAVPLSGYFLMHNTVENKPLYPEQMQKIFELSGAKDGVNQDCINSHVATDQWKCNFAPETYKYIKTPLMILNSALDSWQTACIFTAEPVTDEKMSHANGNCTAVPGWQQCISDVEKCSSAQMMVLDKFEADLSVSLGFTPQTWLKPGNGAFVYSCNTHCAPCSDDAFNRFAINGMTMQQALGVWWKSSLITPATQNIHVPCPYHLSTPHKCNPTC